jgi:tRNA A-37 threonylcarbamoyl transferase component Bud32
MNARSAALVHLDSADYRALSAHAQTLESDGHGEKVLRLADGTYLKLFRRKHLISSAIWSPYALRFAKACHILATYGIPCPDILKVYRIPAVARDAVHYTPLPGHTLRQLLRQGLQEVEAVRLRRQFGALVARLHAHGIYFRSLHLGNVVLTPQDTLGLIDLADIRFYRRALNRFQRRRNFKHLLRYPEEARWLHQTEDFLAAYRAESDTQGV